MVIISFLFVSVPSEAEEIIHDEQITVTAAATPLTFNNSPRNVIIITRAEIENTPAVDIADLLEYYAGIQITTRGPFGVQADVSTGGSSAEQVLIMIDGFPVNNPQTAHMNLNLPVPLENVERIEILSGGSSKTHGPGAFAGVINIITATGSKTKLQATLGGGENGIVRAGMNARFPLAGSENSLALDFKKSDGYMDNTDFKDITASFKTRFPAADGFFSFFLGHERKEFGANGFYTAAFPAQYEETGNTLAYARGNLQFGKLLISPGLSWQQSEDYFLLERSNPSFYTNEHKSNTLGASLLLSYETALGSLSLGITHNKYSLDSSNLGLRERDEMGFTLEQQLTSGVFRVLAGTALYSYNGDWQLAPGMDFGLDIFEGATLYFSLNRAFRLPTFTELYYTSPANRGNENLQPEAAWTYEGGIKYQSGEFTVNATLSTLNQENGIDWIMTGDTGYWEAVNLPETKRHILTTSLIWNPGGSIINKIESAFTGISTDAPDEKTTSKYFYNYLKHKITLNITGNIGTHAKWALFNRFEDRFQGEQIFITDFILSIPMGVAELSLEAFNLLNAEYYDITSIRQPGRWISFQVTFSVLNQ